MKNIILLFSFSFLQLTIYSQSAGANKTICKGETTQIGVAANHVSCDDPAFQYAWTSSPNDPSMSCTNCPSPSVAPEQTTTYTLNGASTVTITVSAPTSITYTKKDPAKKFGFDDWTNFNSILNNGAPSVNSQVPIVSVAKGAKNIIDVDIQPVGSHDCVFHQSSDTLHLEITPIAATSSKYDLELEGINNPLNISPATEPHVSVEAKILDEFGIVADKTTMGSVVIGEPTPSRIDVWVFKPLAVSVSSITVNNFVSAGSPLNWNSTPPNTGAITTMLNDIYEQGAITWNYVVKPTCSCNFDVHPTAAGGFPNRLDIVSPERGIVRTNCASAAENYNMFYVDNQFVNLLGTFVNFIGGVMGFGASFGFADFSGAGCPVRVTSHELGHGLNLKHATGCAAGGPDTFVDNSNTMSYCSCTGDLRAFQWKIIRLEIFNDGFY